jgi:hypothetical protein
MMLCLFKEFVDMVLIENPSNFSSNIILNKKINQFILPILFLIPILNYKNLFRKLLQNIQN